MVKVNNDPENWTKSPEDYEKQMGKFRAKGFICFEEITDYSTLDPAVACFFLGYFFLFKLKLYCNLIKLRFLKNFKKNAKPMRFLKKKQLPVKNLKRIKKRKKRKSQTTPNRKSLKKIK